MSVATPMKVLVVDDDADIRNTFVDVFNDEGYAVESAADGHEALCLMRSAPPSVVILDLMMPKVNGLEVYAAMERDAVLAKVPVVVSTSDPSRAPSGAIVVRKPVDLGRMIDLVGRLCSDRA